MPGELERGVRQGFGFALGAIIAVVIVLRPDPLDDLARPGCLAAGLLAQLDGHRDTA
jgi:hypothetical protein